MIDLIVRPIQSWPGVPTALRRRSRFRTPWSDTDKLLKHELRFLGAKKVVLELEVAERDLRNDGWIRADARPRGPGVILSLESKHGPLRYPCDTFDTWQSNVRAIALGLGALRAVDRYGVTRRGEQYRGWAQLPPPSNGNEFATAEEAAAFVAGLAGLSDVRPKDVLAAGEALKTAYRKAAMVVHPDRPGGDVEQFKRLQAAMEMLEASTSDSSEVYP